MHSQRIRILEIVVGAFLARAQIGSKWGVLIVRQPFQASCASRGHP